MTTIKHQIKQGWGGIKCQRYFFCKDPECVVVYFGEDNSIIEKSRLRQAVGMKQKTDNGLVCYCFGISKNQAANDPKIKEYVIQQTKQGVCSCKTHNPSGKCCLRDFPKTK